MTHSHVISVDASDNGFVPERIGDRYVLVEELGRGGMGMVYRARDEANARDVAFKIMLPAAAAQRQTLTLFEREYYTLVGLKHPRIIEVYDYGVAEGRPYYTMELLDGKDLRELAPLPFREACKHLRDVASSLALLHARKLLHRDVSPRNVRLTSEGRAKLLDFGALASFGWSSDIIGTPPFVAPEALLGSPLDQRADLFALGALSYWLLTGRHAYAARNLEDLYECWRMPVQPPSAIVDDVPEALDNLVMSLLRLDALSRPNSAAAVIDALNAIAGLDAEEQQREAESYLQGGTLVGRTRELEEIGRRLKEAVDGKGSAMLIEADRGVGKTRLLNELALSAQLQGVSVLRANAELQREPFGVVKALALALLRTLPSAAQRHATRFAGTLGHLSPELHEKLGKPALEAMPAFGPEVLARQQHALLAWFTAVATEHPLVVVVDNVHAAHEQSSALLAALAREVRTYRILIAATCARHEQYREGSALWMLRRTAARVRLGNLSAANVDEWVRNVFGDAANASRLAKLLYEHSAGIPVELMDLLRHAVTQGLVTYADGSWILPADISSADFPSRLEDLHKLRLNGLSESAVRLAEALSIQSDAFSLERCFWLAEAKTEAQVFAALDELVAKEVLVGTQTSYRFAHEARRQALLARLGDDRRKALHGSFARALAAKNDRDVSARLEIGWHLLRAGEQSRGADALTRVGLDRELPRQYAPQAVQGLQAALEVYEREGRSAYELAAVLLPLSLLSYYVDHRLVSRYADRALELGFRITGLGLAKRLRPFLGKRLALITALVIASLQFSRARKALREKGIDYSLRDAIGITCTVGPSALGTASIALDLETMKRLAARLEPLAYFGQNHVGQVLYGFSKNAIAYISGQSESELGFAERIELLKKPGAVKGLAEASRTSFYGGYLLFLGANYATKHGQKALEVADEIESLGFKMHSAPASQIRMLYHAQRGEMQLAERARERFELHAIQGGNTWQAELWAPAAMSVPYYMTCDVVNLRRTYEQLSHQAKTLPSMMQFADATRAFYLVARGDYAHSIELFERLTSSIQPREFIGWDSIRGAFAAALNGAGQHARAREVSLETLRQMSALDRTRVASNGTVEVELALAEFGLGNHAEAVRSLEALLAEHANGDNPAYMGLLHKARAQVAFGTGERTVFEEHLQKVERWYKLTQNPTLISQWERLRDSGIRAGLYEDFEAERAGDASATRENLDLSSEVRPIPMDDAHSQRAATLLQSLLHAASAHSGYLFLALPGRLELVASHAIGAAPEWLRQRVATLISGMAGGLNKRVRAAVELQLEHDSDDDEDITKTTHTQPFTLQLGERYCRIVALASQRGSIPKVVGALVIELEPEAVLSLSPELLSASSDALADLISPKTVAVVSSSARA